MARDKLVNGSTCNTQGVLATSKTCGSFKPDSFNIADDIKDNGAVLALAHVMSKLSNSKLDLLAAIIQNDKKTRRQDLCFGQRVYVRYRGLVSANYLSNFMLAFVLDADKNFIRLMSRDGSCSLTYENDGNHLSGPIIYNKAEFDVLRKRMVAQDMMVDPDEKRNTVKRLRSMEDYQMQMTSESEQGTITTLETVFEENDLPRKKSNINDLTSIVREIEGGFDLKRTKSADRYRVPKRRRTRKVKDQSIQIS